MPGLEIGSADGDPAHNRRWRAVFLIDNERPYVLRIFVDANRDESTEWIFDKLLFMRFWWGRIAASDFIFDVEAERFVYEEMAWYGGIAFQQFQESCDDACPCRFPPPDRRLE